MVEGKGLLCFVCLFFIGLGGKHATGSPTLGLGKESKMRPLSKRETEGQITHLNRVTYTEFTGFGLAGWTGPAVLSSIFCIKSRELY